MKRCVDYFQKGQSACDGDIIDFIACHKMVLSGVAIAVIFTTGAPWWVPLIPQSFTVSTMLVAAIAVLLLAASLVYLRKRTIRSLRVKALLHNFAHYVRDQQTKVLIGSTQGATLCSEEGVNSGGFNEYITRLCELTQNYFKLITHDSTIGCAIRLAREAEESIKGSRVVYHTSGRSSNLSPDREKMSEDIPANQGIPRYLSEGKNNRGVLRYNDLVEAANLNVFHPTENEKQFADEVVTMFVAPINGWDGKNQSMVGLLFVTSRGTKTFRKKHVDSMRFIADTVASSLCFTVQHSKENGLADKAGREMA